MSRRTRVERYNFRGAYAPPLTASRDGGPWTKADTSTGGSPTVQTASGMGMQLALTADNEVQNLCLYMGDVLPYDIDDLIRVEFIAQISASLDAAVSAALGVASARNDAIDSIAQHASHRVIGNNTLVVETDDGTNDNDDIATGETLSNAWKRLVVDFAGQGTTQSAPSQSLAGKSNVQFLVSNANGSQRRVATTTRFDMSNYAGNLQLYAQLQKTAAAATATLSILEVCVEYTLPL